MLAGASSRSEAQSIILARQPLLLWPLLPGNDPQACKEEREKPFAALSRAQGVQTLSQMGAELQHEAREGCLQISPCISMRR